MKSQKQNVKKKLQHLSEEERSNAFKWIDSLSSEQLKTFGNHRDQVELAQALLEAYLNRKGENKSRKSK